MSATISRALSRGLAPAILALVWLAPPAAALRLVGYNLLNYPGSTGPARAPYYRTILDPLNADLIVAEEMNAGGTTAFLNEVLNVLDPGEWTAAPFIDGNDTDSALFYKPAKVQFLGQSSFYPNPANHLRLIHVYRLLPVGYSNPASVLRIYSGHLKASQGFENQRLQECIGVRDSMNAMPAGTHALFSADMNFYTLASEPGYTKLTESQSNNVGRLYDMLPAGAWHDGPQFAPYHTQSPCKDAPCASGAATGGMDDRFDMTLMTYNLATGQGLSAIPGTCISVGNDGQHLNKNITDAPIIPEGAGYATALKLASDHLPVRLDLQLPAKIRVAAELAFGRVILGAPDQHRDLGIANPAVPPADSLNCTFTPPAGFSSPNRAAVAAGDSVVVVVSMSTESVGQKAGTLAISCDAPEDPSREVALSGTVLDHAAGSLDSTVVEYTGAVDFGDHPPGAFSDQPVSVYNVGYNPLQARLSLESAQIAGGAGRFSIVGGFQPVLIGGAGQEYSLHFDDSGVNADSTFQATLTFGSADEPLPGAQEQPDLVVNLRARVRPTNGVADLPPPSATRLLEAVPNPVAGGTEIRLEIARAIAGDVSIFDAGGRHVSTLRAGTMAPGRYVLAWNGRNDRGDAVGSGVYFVRLAGAGLGATAMRLVVVR